MNTALGRSMVDKTSQQGAAPVKRSVARAAWISAVVVAALAYAATFVPSAVPHAASAAVDEPAIPSVPYYPSLFINQAAEPSPAPPTF